MYTRHSIAFDRPYWTGERARISNENKLAESMKDAEKKKWTDVVYAGTGKSLELFFFRLKSFSLSLFFIFLLIRILHRREFFFFQRELCSLICGYKCNRVLKLSRVRLLLNMPRFQEFF